jgi:hypothetical protein
MVRSVRERLDCALPVMRASSSSEPGAFSAMTRSSSRLPADSTLAKDLVEVNQTLAHRLRVTIRISHRSPLLVGRQLGARVHVALDRGPMFGKRPRKVIGRL